MSFISYQLSGKYIHLMMMYNLILALVPYVLQKIKVKSKIIYGLIRVVWLLFLPNTFYMLTDLIHIGLFEFKVYDDVYSQVYVQNIVPWIELTSYILIILVGVWIGVKTIYNELHEYDYRLRKPLTLIIGVLCSVGVYIGRYLRLNSWDVLNPVGILNLFFESFNLFSIEFIALFSIIIIVLILAYDTYCEK